MPAVTLKRPFAALAALAVVATLAGCSDDEPDRASDAGSTSSSPEASGSPESGSGACAYVPDAAQAEDAPEPPSGEPLSGTVPVSIDTSAGPITATLDADAAPCTVTSFVSLAEQGYFDGTSCHRLTTAGIHVLQCGDPTGTGAGGPGYSFADELTGEETYAAGTLAMANAGPDTNGSQFFIVYQSANGALGPDYTEFGTITKKSLAEVRKVAADGVQGGGTDGPPATPVEISSVTVE